MSHRALSSALALLGCLAACQGANGPSGARSAGPLATLDRAVAAIDAGTLRFEVRGLKNEESGSTTYGTTFLHKATVVAIGDSSLSKLPYELVYSIKRLSGGDPKAPRESDDRVAVLVLNGVGDLSFSGGYKSATDKWDPEVVELTPFAMIPVFSFHGPTVHE